jgi:tRNA A37 threonylcarbamoyladenosine dehydratase
MEKLFRAKVAVFGVGGVGGYTVEALSRSGIGRLDLFDYDEICVTNINRQIHATTKTVGWIKVEAAKERILEINPEIAVNTHKMLYLPETSSQVDLSVYDYVVDAIDTVAGKIELVVRAGEVDTPIISCMGAGNKVKPSMLEVADIYKTSVCPLAKVMRYELKKRNVKKLKVVYSKELPIKRERPPGSVSFVPSTAGLIIAGEVVNGIINC